MKKMCVSVLAMCTFASMSFALTVEAVGNSVFVAGQIGGGEDLDKLKAAIERTETQQIVIVNSPGGDSETAMKVGRLITERKLRTVAAGRCVSACALLFMGGVERQFGQGSTPLGTLVGFHGSTYEGKVDRQQTGRMLGFLKERFAEKFDSTAMNEALFDIRDGGGYLFVRELERNQGKDREAYFCESGSTKLPDCKVHSGKDAFTLG